MDQFSEDLKKVIKAGMGAIATGLEKGQEALEALAQKGEPLYEQAKSAVTDAADKVKQTFDSMSPKPQAQEIIDVLRGMTREDWAQVRAALDEFEAQAAEAEQAAQEAAEAAQDILNKEKADAEEKTEEPEADEASEETDKPQE